MPQVLGVVGQLLFVFALTDEDLLHVAWKGLLDRWGYLLIPAGHATLVKGFVATAWASLEFIVLVLADVLVELFTVIEFGQAIEKDVSEVLGKAHDVAAEVQQIAVGLSSAG